MPRVTNRTVNYEYDNAGRLTQESGRDGAGVAYQSTWTLDDAGNRRGEVKLRVQNVASTNWLVAL
jgi:hypothetical protein